MRGRRWARGWIAALACAASVTVGSSAAASPEDLFGYGGRTSAMGATGVAHAGGYETAWHNPALASTVRADKLTLGYGGANFRLDLATQGALRRLSTPSARGILIGAEVPVPFGGRLRDRVGIALAFYTPTDVVVRGRVLYPETPQFPVLPDRAQSVTIRAGVGADIGYGIKLGVGFAALAEIVGTVVAATDATGRVGTRVEDQLVATYAPVLGATYDLPEWTKLRLGVAYRGTLDARFAIVVDGTKLSSLAIPLFNISGHAQYDPAQLAFEVSRIDALNVLSLQLVYKKWSSYPGILEPTVVCSEGGAGACGLLPPSIPWRDTFALRVGAEQGFPLTRALTVRARGGAFYEKSPLPDALPGSEAFDPALKGVGSVPTRYYDADRVALTAGMGVSLGDKLPPIDLDLYGQYHVLMPRTLTSRDGAGTVLSEAEASGYLTVFGMTAGVKF